MRWMLLLLLAACAGAVEQPAPVEAGSDGGPVDAPVDAGVGPELDAAPACEPAPSTYVAWLGTDGFVHVSRKTGPPGTPWAIIQHFEPSSAPIRADFGDQAVLVLPDLTLCAA